MKKSRQILALLLALFMVVSLFAACGDSDSDPTDEPEETVEPTEAPPVEEDEDEEEEEDEDDEDEEEPAAGGGVVTDGEGWYLWDDDGNLTLEGRDAVGEQVMVSAGKYEASLAGVQVMEAGGNAVDAAVAVGFALSVTEPNSSGIGGGGFMTIRAENGDTLFLDFRERAPQGATPEMWVLNEEGRVIGGQNMTGGKAVGIPGEVAGLWYAYENYGSGNLSWAELIEPAITLAEDGFIITPTLYNDMLSSYDAMVTYNEFGDVFLNEDGLNYQVGDTFKNPDMAKTLRMIAEGGADAFYTGELAEAMVNAINKYGGVFTVEDFEDYEVKVYEPVSGTYRGYEILSSPLPSSGGTHIIQVLNIMENFDIAEMGAGSAESIHVYAEALKMAFYDRGLYMGDPEYVDVPVSGLLSKSYAALQAEQIDMDSVLEYEEIDPWQYEHEDTTHFSVADAAGNVVAVTQTVNGGFGSKVVPSGYGFVLNNEMGDFSSDPESPNAIAPGKTPLSSMSPTIVLNEDGSPFMTLGAPGATAIIGAVVQVISNVVDHGMTIQEAIDAPRTNNNATSPISYENRLSEDVIAALEALGHEVSESDPWSRSFGSIQAILYGDDGLLYGGADPRRDNKALGY